MRKKISCALRRCSSTVAIYILQLADCALCALHELVSFGDVCIAPGAKKNVGSSDDICLSYCTSTFGIVVGNYADVASDAVQVEKIEKRKQGNRRIFVVVSRPTFAVLDLDGELLQVLVMLHVFVNSLTDEFRAIFAVFLLPLSVFLLRGLLSLLLFGC